VSRVTRAVFAPLVVAGLLLLASCAGNPSKSPIEPGPDQPIAVDTPALRAQKADAGIAACPPSEGTPASAGGLPDVTLPCLGGGRAVNLAKLTGTPTVINFWAQSCGPCQSESPHFEHAYQQGGDSIRILGVDWQDTSPSRALAFADELGLTYPQLADPGGATRASIVRVGLPVTIFVDAAGEITHLEAGAIASYKQLETLISDHLGVDISAGSGR
jgi:cytochrome c biogenesis protein CcmG/thiol:disulfide interchange protein DsbE